MRLVSDAEEIMQMHVLGRFGFELWRTLTKTEKYSNLQFQELKVGEDADIHASAFQMFSNHGISYSRLPLQHKRAILGAWS